MRFSGAAFFILLALGCSPTGLTHLEWIESTDPLSRAAQNIEAANFVLYSVCGYSCNTPAVHHADLEMCYSKSTTVEIIDPTGDVIDSEKHLELKDAAREFARVHNSAIRDYLDSHRMSECKNGERWAEVMDRIFEYRELNSSKKFGGGVGFNLRNRSDLRILINTKGLSRALAPETLCNILKSARIQETVTITDYSDSTITTCNGARPSNR